MRPSRIHELLLIPLFLTAVCGGCGSEAPTMDAGTDASIDGRVARDGSVEDDAAVDADSMDTSTDTILAAPDRGVDGGMPRPPTGGPIRGSEYFGVPERFNRVYTDPSFVASATFYVDPTAGTGAGTLADPTSPDDAFSRVAAGESIHFLAGTYSGCWQLGEDQSGTYEAPILIDAARTADGDSAVHIDCCETGRRACFNLEGADHIAIRGFELEGGYYGVRAVGPGYEQDNHQRGIAILYTEAFDQASAPFFASQSDWIALDGNIGHGAGPRIGHGIYLSNGGDWMIVRGNELYDNSSSDCQINADPQSTCADVSIAYDDPRCDGSARDGLGQGVSEFVRVENNYFHDGTGQGPNFTSVRESIFRNNIVGRYARHGVSFWQETDNPRLGSSDNVIAHNLFIGLTAGRHMLQFVGHSDRNIVRNNIFVAVAITGGVAMASPDPVLVEVDGETAPANIFDHNYYVGGTFDGHAAGETETHATTFDARWFESFPIDATGLADDYAPSAGSPFRDAAPRTEHASGDRDSVVRTDPTALGPFETP